jgi:uncharacterized protein YbjQ (UPF0145 family)
MNGPLLVTTSTHALDRRIRDVKGLVVGHAVVTADESEFSNEPVVENVEHHAGYTQAFAHARNAAMAALLADARRLGANAVVDLRLDFRVVEPDTSTTICVSLTGTAVVTE